MQQNKNQSRMSSKERAEHCLLSLPYALYHAVHDYPGGVAALAGAHGLSAATLQNKVNFNLASHVPNIKDLEAVCISTQDHRILRTICSWFNAGFFIFPDAPAGNESLFARGVEVAQEVSELMATVQTALAHGHATHDDAARLDNVLQELVTAAKSMVEAAKAVGHENHDSHAA